MPTEPVIIALRPNGPYVIKSPNVLVRRPDGTEVSQAPDIALCRCGHSANKPFCDKSHRRVGFVAE